MMQGQKEEESKLKQLEVIKQQRRELSSNSHSKEGTASDLVRSNEAFKKVAISACEKFPLVVAIWGKAHFICNNELFYDLEQAKIRSIVLLPNAKKSAEAEAEGLWQRQKIKIVKFAIESKSDEDLYGIPKIFENAFHPSIRRLFTEEVKQKEAPVVLNTAKFLELARRRDTLRFSSGVKYHFEGFPAADFNIISDQTDYENEDKKLEKSKSDIALNYLSSGINNMLLVGSLRLSSLTFEGTYKCSPTYVDEKPVVKLSSNKIFTITLTGENLYGSMRHLLREMKRQNRPEWVLKPGQRAIFLDISLEERQKVLDNPDKEGIAWLESRKPKNSILQLVGELGIQPGAIHSAHGVQEGLCMEAGRGGKIILRAS